MFFPLFRSLTLSAHFGLILAIFFLLLLPSSSFGAKCQALYLSQLWELHRRRRGCPMEEGEGDMSWPAFLGLNVRDLLKCQQGFDAGIYGTEAKGMIFTFLLLSRSEKYSHNYCLACIDSTLNPFESICLRVDAFLCVAWCWYAVACTHGHISKTAKTGGR